MLGYRDEYFFLLLAVSLTFEKVLKGQAIYNKDLCILHQPVAVALTQEQGRVRKILYTAHV